MSKLKISPNLFLEVNELTKAGTFIEEQGYKRLMSCLIDGVGVVKNSTNTYFKVSAKTGEDNVVIVNAGIAYDTSLNGIVLREDVEMTIGAPSNSAARQWILLKRAVTNYEEGSVSVSEQGVLSGTGTEFLSVLRGQPNFPTKVAFNSNRNTGEYEVVEVTSDTEAIIAGDFTSETGLMYKVIGTFTPGFVPNDDDKAIYEYDSCLLSVVESEDAPSVDDDTYILASVGFNALGSISDVTDERARNTLNNPYSTSANSESVGEDLFVALRRTSIRGDRLLDIQFEWGFKISKYDFTGNATTNVFTVITGESKYVEKADAITDDMFRGWLLVNRKNLLSVEITSNEKNMLYISEYNSSLITGSDDDFVIVPPFDLIEVRAEVTGDGYEDDDVEHYFRYSVKNLRSRFLVPIEYGETHVELRYRLLNEGGSTTAWLNFMNTQFENIQGIAETLGASSFDITVSEAMAAQRNYS